MIERTFRRRSPTLHRELLELRAEVERLVESDPSVHHVVATRTEGDLLTVCVVPARAPSSGAPRHEAVANAVEAWTDW